jgi:hypothetical protein
VHSTCPVYGVKHFFKFSVILRISIGAIQPGELVDEGQDRGVPHPTHLHEFLRLRFDPLPLSTTISALSTAVRTR